jgi:hypothetical protein
MMCDKDLIVSYVYDDLSDHERGRAEQHLRSCAACREEVAGLRGLRTTLAAWAPPEPDLAFRVVGGRQAEAASTWRTRWLPAFGLAAAAVLVLAAASALAHLQIQYGSEGLSVRTGWERPLQVVQPAVAAVAPAANEDQAKKLEVAYADIERRLRELESSRPAADSPVRSAAFTQGSRLSDAQILKQVENLLAQSESRQQQELALRIAQVARDVDAQRTADLARIQQGLGRIDAMTTAEVNAHRDLANIIMTSSRQQK